MLWSVANAGLCLRSCILFHCPASGLCDFLLPHGIQLRLQSGFLWVRCACDTPKELLNMRTKEKVCRYYDDDADKRVQHLGWYMSDVGDRLDSRHCVGWRVRLVCWEDAVRRIYSLGLSVRCWE